MNISEIREKYPQYNGLSDTELASVLHSKYYADKMDYDSFAAKIGLEPANQAMPEGNALDMVIEPVQQIGGSMLNMARAGWGGLSELAMTQDPMAAANAVNESMANLPSYAPETQAGQQGAEVFGDVMGAVGDAGNYVASGLAGQAIMMATNDINQAVEQMKAIQNQGVSDYLGGTTLEKTDSPLAATIASMAPDIAGAVTGGIGAKTAAKNIKPIPLRRRPKGLVTDAGYPEKGFLKALESKGITYGEVIDEIPRLPDNMPPGKAVEEIIRRKLKAGDADAGLARYKLDDAGRVVNYDLAEEAIKQGFEAGDISFIRQATPETKRKMLKMARDRRKISKNKRLAQDIDPYNVVGESAMERVNHVRQTVLDARDKLGKIAADRLGEINVNARAIAETFMDELKKLNVAFDENTGALDFSLSKIAKDKSAQRLIRDVQDLLRMPKAPTALRAHELKQQLDALIDFQKKGKRGLTESGRRLAKSVRHEVNQVLRAVDDEYAYVNDVMSRGIGVMDDFDKSMGSVINTFEDWAEPAVGRKLRGMLSSNDGRYRMTAAVKAMDETAKEFGGVFKDDIGDLVQFANTLDARFGTTAPNSFQGGIEKGVKQVVRGWEGLKDAAADAAVAKYQASRGINDTNAYLAIEKILKSEGLPQYPAPYSK